MSEGYPALAHEPLSSPTCPTILDEEADFQHGLENTSSSPTLNTHKKNMSNDQRRLVYEFLLQRYQDSKLKVGAISEAAVKFSVATKTISRIWHRGQTSNSSSPGHIIPTDVSSRKKGRVGRKKLEFDLSRVQKVPLRRRMNIRSLACALNMPKSTLYDRIKEGLIRSHTNAVKPYHTDKNKTARLRYCMSMLEQSSLNQIISPPIFQEMFNVIHIDEKWFFMSKAAERYYLAPGEAEPHRTCKGKKFIPKVMFLAAVARPRFDSRKNQFFNGKIGIFPMVYKEAAKRSSKNRPAGTMETKPIQSITRDVIKKTLIDEVLPAIRAKWPQGWSGPIFIQQDNAKPHVIPNDPDFVEEARKEGFDIRLRCQPPNSPDLNVLDLGYFRAIQTLQYQKAPRTVDELLAAVEDSFQELERNKLNNVFLTMQQCMIEIMKVGGGNNYKLPHMGKVHLERQGRLPVNLSCDFELFESVNTILQQESTQ